MKLKLFVFVAAHMLAVLCVQAQTAQTLEAKITAIMNRPEFRHALFGTEIYSLSDNKVLYSINADKLFVAGSVTKVVTEGVTMQLLGVDYRFRTPIYRTGPISSDGVLKGDLVLVASGDPNLSGRVSSATSMMLFPSSEETELSLTRNATRRQRADYMPRLELTSPAIY